MDAVRAWIADDVDPAAAAELQELLDGGATDELAARFSASLTFGTAGLRGPLRAGPNGMNRTVVRRAAAGLAAWLGVDGGVVVLGYDARHGSATFARDSAAVFTAAGFEARLLPGPLPTPVLAYAVTRLGARAGVMVTASHNPRHDNGYKVYGSNGAQIISPADREIEASIRVVGPSREIPMDDDYTLLDDAIVASYVAAIAALAGAPRARLRIVHTATHGVGTAVVRRVFAAAGYPEPISVAAQAEPDPDFPTLPFPNPEEPGALDLSFELARAVAADLIIASDPDADRCAVALNFPNAGWRMLRGDELGMLLADALLAKGVRGTYATTIVSSSMLAQMAHRHGVGYGETLTGFKWIVRAAPDLVYGYEEALGYAVAPDLVRDKDGVSAALLVAERASALAAEGSSLIERLDELALDYGVYATDQISIRVDDLSLITDTMRRLRADPPRRLLDHDVATDDLRPAADVLRLTWPGGRVIVRPSGTEPKLKAYLEVVVAVEDSVPAARGVAAGRLAALRDELRPLIS
jgi:phosphomannomutase